MSIKTIKYLQCNHCYYIYKYPPIIRKHGIKKIKCQLCSRIGLQDIWPSKEILELFNLANSLFQQNIYKKNISYVITGSTLEYMLEDLISTMLLRDIIEYGSYEIVKEALFDGYQGRSRLLTLFKNMGYKSFKEYTNILGYKDFCKKWDIIAEKRNMFVHGKFEKYSAVLEENHPTKNNATIDIKEFLQEVLEVFKGINNIFVQNYLQYHNF